MRQPRAPVSCVLLTVLVSLPGYVGDSTKAASDIPATSPIAYVQGERAPPTLIADGERREAT